MLRRGEKPSAGCVYSSATTSCANTRCALTETSSGRSTKRTRGSTHGTINQRRCSLSRSRAMRGSHRLSRLPAPPPLSSPAPPHASIFSSDLLTMLLLWDAGCCEAPVRSAGIGRDRRAGRPERMRGKAPPSPWFLSPRSWPSRGCVPQGCGLEFLEDLSSPQNSHRPPPACYCPEKMKKADMVVCLGGEPSCKVAAQPQGNPARLHQFGSCRPAGGGGRAGLASLIRATPPAGDGTILWVSGLYPGPCPPILSFSMGSLGFLTPFNFNDYKAVFPPPCLQEKICMARRGCLRLSFFCTPALP